MEVLLEFSLLGEVTFKLGGEPLTGLASRRTEALLIYLVCTGQPHSREALATLLWDERSQSLALGNLRVLLTNLRQTVGPYVTITRQTVAFNLASPHWLDVAEMEAGLAEIRSQRTGDNVLSANQVAQLARSLSLYRGDFLQGFYLRDSRGFEEWQVAERERLRLQVIEGLHQLVTGYLALGDYPAGLEQARRLLQLDPLRETTHRQLMLLLTYRGQRNAALSQYEICRQILADELSVEPMAETTALYEQIRAGQVNALRSRHYPAPSASPPPLPAVLSLPPGKELPVVAREEQLNQLDEFLGQALAGYGQVAFVTGDAGSGKTTLIQEFTRRAQEAHNDLIVAGGHCSVQSGLGDPFLPFAEVLSLLTGDIEAKWAGGMITRENAGRLWALAPVSIPVLLELGPDLIDSFVSGSRLRSRLTVLAVSPGTSAGGDRNDHRARLEQLVSRQQAGREGTSFQQQNLFEQYLAVLQTLAARQPLLLLLEDLHWAAPSSISLLFHLGRRLGGSPILVVGNYRPEDVAVGWQEGPHPLVEVISEFKRDFGEMSLDLDRAIQRDGRRFIDTLVDTQPNRLEEQFRETLFRHTGGHPLFTIELLRDMEERGALQQDSTGTWVAGPTLDWTTLSPRVEGVIQKRIGRLPAELRRALRVASVEGETFTAEVVARVQAVDEQELIRRFSAELVRQHRLVTSPSVEWVGSQPLSRYRFRHQVFQQYLYQTLDEVERRQIHQAVGRTLETLYGEQVEPVAAQLAGHFQAAGNVARAVDYFIQAGNRAYRLSAYEEAVEQLRQGLAILSMLPDTPARTERESALQISLAKAMKAGRS